jgi:hypothetical protein
VAECDWERLEDFEYLQRKERMYTFLRYRSG